MKKLLSAPAERPALPAPVPPPRSRWRRFWRYGRALIAPLLIWLLLMVARIDPWHWIQGEDSFDQAALQEWLEEARNHDRTLSDMIGEYFKRSATYARRRRQAEAEATGGVGKAGGEIQGGGALFRLQVAEQRMAAQRSEIYQHLRALGEPPTKMYPGQLPLFPTIYRLEVRFDFTGLPEDQGGPLGSGGPRLDEPIVWDSGLPGGQSRSERFALHPRGSVLVRYQLHAFNKRQRIEQEQRQRVRLLGLLAVAATALAAGWLWLLVGREREQERQRLLAQQQVHLAERALLREEARHAETERELLEQRLATQAAERQALELKSHLYASIGIMAGSYAHNIKNLLVRPNDLLRRCLEADGLTGEQETMVREVQQTLGTVTERLQQILQTVRRDPSQSERKAVDLNALLGALGHTWRELACDRWKLDLALELGEGPLWLAGDVSHLQQAVENLLFNARDATFEMRNHLRDAARRAEGLDGPARRQAVIAAAAWRGRVVLRTRREGEAVVLEVSDNGAGMTEEVRRRCTETHFSTKRDNALYEGHSTGMGLGLSFVVAILEHHEARLEVESAPLQGTTFRVRFPGLAEDQVSANA
jgi:signal transduction histidine kinase